MYKIRGLQQENLPQRFLHIPSSPLRINYDREARKTKEVREKQGRKLGIICSRLKQSPLLIISARENIATLDLLPTEDCLICTPSFDETSGVPLSFCCRCSKRLRNKCKDKCSSDSTHDGEHLLHNDPRPSCRGNDELYGRSADFWGGRRRRQELIKKSRSSSAST